MIYFYLILFTLISLSNIYADNAEKNDFQSDKDGYYGSDWKKMDEEFDKNLKKKKKPKQKTKKSPGKKQPRK